MIRRTPSLRDLSVLLLALPGCDDGGGRTSLDAYLPPPYVDEDAGGPRGLPDAYVAPQDGCLTTDPLDDLGVDENCDGADGMAATSIYVSADTGVDAYGGSPRFPVRTLTQAWLIHQAYPARNQIVLAASTTPYPVGSVDALARLLADGCVVVGGVDAAQQWSRPAGASTPADATVVLNHPEGTHVAGGVGASLSFLELRTDGDEAVRASGYVDSIGLYLDGATDFSLAHVRVVAADGLAGLPGAVGPNGEDRSGEATSNYLPFAAPINFSCGNNSRAQGGNGGAEAYRVSLTAYFPPTPGSPGGGGAPGGVVGGNGGPGTAGSVGLTGSPGGVDPYFEFDGSRFSAASPSGGRAYMGDGGGGGGGAGMWNGVVVGSVSSGGGGGGCGGYGGYGGFRGGSSIALLLNGDAPSVVDVSLVAGNAGDGGDGGDGGFGGPGGRASEPEPAASVGQYRGGKGGDGGQGGRGGGGTGGNGGWSVAWLELAVLPSPPATPTGVTLTIGTAGSPGAGGLPNGVAGVAGEARTASGMP